MRLWQTRYMRINWDFCLGALAVVAIMAGAVYTATPGDAATASVTYTFSSGQKIVASQMNQNFNDILGAINGNLNTDNISDGGIATADLASSVVTTVKLANDSVTSAKIIDASVATADIAQHAVSASKLAQANIVTADVTPFGAGQDQNCVVASASITLAVDRPVLIMFANKTGVSDYGNSSGSWEVQTSFRLAGATQSTVEAAGSNSLNSCASYFHYIDQPGVGTHAYTFLNTLCPSIQTTSQFRNCKLILEEL